MYVFSKKKILTCHVFQVMSLSLKTRTYMFLKKTLFFLQKNTFFWSKKQNKLLFKNCKCFFKKEKQCQEYISAGESFPPPVLGTGFISVNFDNFCD